MLRLLIAFAMIFGGLHAGAAEPQPQPQFTDYELSTAIETIQAYYELVGICAPSQQNVCWVYNTGTNVLIAAPASAAATAGLLALLTANAKVVQEAVLRISFPALVATGAGFALVIGSTLYYVFGPNPTPDVPFDQSVLAGEANFRRFLEMPAGKVLRYARQYPKLASVIMVRAEIALAGLREPARINHHY